MSTADVAAVAYLVPAGYGAWLAVHRAGLPLLGQGAFVAIGAVGTAQLGPGGAGWPLGLAVLASMALAAAVGVVVAFGSARLERSSMALATWALAWLVSSVLADFPSVGGGTEGLTRSTPAHLVSRYLGVSVEITPAAHLAIAAACSVGAALLLGRLLRGPAGLDLAALRDGPLVAVALGVPVAQRRREVLGLAAALGALSGAGALVLQGVVAPSDVSPLLSVELLAAVLIGGRRLWGPPVGVAVVSMVPTVAGWLADRTVVPAGPAEGLLVAGLLLAALLVPARRRSPTGAATLPEPPEPVPGPLGQVRLEARGLVASYGGSPVLTGVDLEVRTGEVHALLGPNGSGKTTLLRVLSGALAPDAGSVVLNGTDITGLSEDRRVAAGVARTFQPTVMLGDLSAVRQVEVGARVAVRRPGSVLRHLIGARTAGVDERRRLEVVAASMRRAQLPEATDLHVHGDQRLVQVARAAATGAGVLLLDEPGAGMTSEESHRLAAALRELAAEGRAVVVVEHDMRLVAQVADRVTVLADGVVISSGTMAEVQADPRVVRAYLGAATIVSE